MPALSYWMKGDTTRAYVFLHTAVLLYGFTAILGKLITLPGTTIVWYRMAITAASLCFFPGLLRAVRKLGRKGLRPMILTGIIITTHWIGFYESIKYANASIALSCMAATSLFTAFLEPLYLKRKIRMFEIMLGGVVIAGFGFIFGFAGEKFWVGMVIGLIAALLAAWFSVWTKTFIHKYDATVITFVQFASGLTYITLVLPLYLLVFPDTPTLPAPEDWVYILILSLVCTTLAYVLTMKALRHLEPFTMNLGITMEPIYGILMAYFILHEDEELHPGFYLGAILILVAVVIHPVVGRLQKRRRQHGAGI